MVLVASDDVARYRIAVPDGCELRGGHNGFDYVVVSDPDWPDKELWLFDEILTEAARGGAFGVRLLAEERL
jgi:hypothetical protein